MRLITLFILTLSFGTIGQVNRSLDTVLMGSSFSFTAITDTDSLAGIAVRSAVNEVVRIESLISSWDPNSGRITSANSQVIMHASLIQCANSKVLWKEIRENEKYKKE